MKVLYFPVQIAILFLTDLNGESSLGNFPGRCFVHSDSNEHVTNKFVPAQHPQTWDIQRAAQKRGKV